MDSLFVDDHTFKPSSFQSNLHVNSKRLSDNKDFGELLDRVKAGDEDATRELYVACRKYLLLIANQDLQPQALQKFGASDVVQQSLVIANNKIGEFRGRTQGEFFAWVRQILLNECRQSTRHYLGTEKRNASREVSCSNSEVGKPDKVIATDPHMTPSTLAASQEQAVLVQAAMRKLSPQNQLVIEMRNWQGLPFDDIGCRIGKSADAARKAWSRAVLALEAELRRMNAIE